MREPTSRGCCEGHTRERHCAPPRAAFSLSPSPQLPPAAPVAQILSSLPGTPAVSAVADGSTCSPLERTVLGDGCCLAWRCLGGGIPHPSPPPRTSECLVWLQEPGSLASSSEDSDASHTPELPVGQAEAEPQLCLVRPCSCPASASFSYRLFF